MNSWPESELALIRAGDDLHVSPLRADGKTHGTPTWIWSVVVDGQLYVRAYHGQRSSWYQAAIARPAGRVQVAGMIRTVLFDPVSAPELQAWIDAAYRAKYADSPYLGAMIGDRARSATLRLVPQASV